MTGAGRDKSPDPSLPFPRFPVSPFFPRSSSEVSAIQVGIFPFPTFLTIRTERLECVAIPVTQIQVAISPGVELNLAQYTLRDSTVQE